MNLWILTTILLTIICIWQWIHNFGPSKTTDDHYLINALRMNIAAKDGLNAALKGNIEALEGLNQALRLKIDALEINIIAKEQLLAQQRKYIKLLKGGDKS